MSPVSQRPSTRLDDGTMSTSTSTSAHTGAASARASLAEAVAAGAVGAVAVNALLSAVARGPLDASSQFQPLTLPVVVMWSVMGVVIGGVGWPLIRNRAQRPGRLLRWLVPTVLALSLLPDLALYLSDSMPGTSGNAVLALVAMHLATAAVAVTAYRRFMLVTH